MTFYSTPIDWFVETFQEIKPLQDYQWDNHWGHPLEQGFRKIQMAEFREGKSEDWVYSLKIPTRSCGRLHAQMFYGQWFFHWDEFDPDQGQVFEHLAQETKIGPWLLLGGIILGTVLVGSFSDNK